MRRALMSNVTINPSQLGNTLTPDLMNTSTASQQPSEDSLLNFYRNRDVDVTSGLVMNWLCALGYERAAAYCLRRGADPNQKDQDNICPIHLAIYSGRTALVRLLVARGASIDVPDCNGETPFELAVRFRNLDIVRVLQKKMGRSLYKPPTLDEPSLKSFAAYVRFNTGRWVSWLPCTVPFLAVAEQIVAVVAHQMIKDSVKVDWLTHNTETGRVSLYVNASILQMFIKYASSSKTAAAGLSRQFERLDVGGTSRRARRNPSRDVSIESSSSGYTFSDSDTSGDDEEEAPPRRRRAGNELSSKRHAVRKFNKSAKKEKTELVVKRKRSESLPLPVNSIALGESGSSVLVDKQPKKKKVRRVGKKKRRHAHRRCVSGEAKSLATIEGYLERSLEAALSETDSVTSESSMDSMN
mmetsp:Transcript_20786/g.23119  ORF Transcript_20786/g.23119 Transcript_20786/m.23119 type:complete len:412 (+) Transcript_20786:93-1328(+)